MIPPCLEKHVKPLVLRLISFRSCRIAVPLDYEGKGTESAPVPAHTHAALYNISRADSWSPLKLTAVVKIAHEDYICTYSPGSRQKTRLLSDRSLCYICVPGLWYDAIDSLERPRNPGRQVVPSVSCSEGAGGTQRAFDSGSFFIELWATYCLLSENPQKKQSIHFIF